MDKNINTKKGLLTMKRILILMLMIFGVVGITNATPEYHLYDFESGVIPSNFTQTPNTNKYWKLNNGGANNSQYSIKNKDIGNNQKAGINLNNISVNSGFFEFDYKTSIELNYDYLHFYINNQEVDKWSGAIDWTHYKYYLDSGVYNFSWVYIKDNSQSSGKDEVYIDNIKYMLPIANQNTNKENIINYTLPNESQLVTTNDFITAKLNKKADCDLYINNNLVKKYKQILGFNYLLTDYENGDYSYFVYCDYYVNSTTHYEVTKTKHFNINKPKKTIEFTILDKNNNIANIDELYLITPCPNEQEFKKYWIKEKNKSYYIQPVINGKSSFNLSYNGEYEFCLLNGKVNYKMDDYSNKYDFVDVLKELKLGDLFVNNQTLSYTLKVDNEDLYKPINPQFWGKNWSALFQLIVGIIIGGLMILIGLGASMDKLVIVGGLIIAIGMGLSFSTLVGVVI